MQSITKMILCLLAVSVLTACASQDTEDPRERRKIYLTEEDYLEDIGNQAEKERRAAQPLVESDYIFNVVPETEKAVYFFDERQQPKVPGQPSDADHKKEKRLWKKPKRYSPEEYYGMQEGGDGGGEQSYDY